MPDVDRPLVGRGDVGDVGPAARSSASAAHSSRVAVRRLVAASSCDAAARRRRRSPSRSWCPTRAAATAAASPRGRARARRRGSAGRCESIRSMSPAPPSRTFSTTGIAERSTVPAGTSAGAARSRRAGSGAPPCGSDDADSIPRRRAAPVVQRRREQRLADAPALQARPHGVRRQAPHLLAVERRREAEQPGVVLGDPAAARVGLEEVLGPAIQLAPRAAGRGSGSGQDRRDIRQVELVEALRAEPLGGRHVLGAHRPDGHVGDVVRIGGHGNPRYDVGGDRRMARMRVLVAPDKFAGTLTAVEAAEAIADGLAPARPRRRARPRADVRRRPGLRRRAARGARAASCSRSPCAGPLGDPVPADGPARRRHGVRRERPGVRPAPDRRRAAGDAPRTYGVGELLVAALDAGAAHGRGRARRQRHQRRRSRPARRPGRDAPTGRSTPARPGSPASPRSTSRPPGPGSAASSWSPPRDVDNPLTGLFGATKVFGPQKGIPEERLPAVDGVLEELAGRRRPATLAWRRAPAPPAAWASRCSCSAPPASPASSWSRTRSGCASGPGRPTW